MDIIKPENTVEELAKSLCKGDIKLEEKFTEALKKLTSARDNIFHHSSPPTRYKFKSGDIVYNRKNEEFGFIVGTIDPWSDNPEDPTLSRYKRYLMITLSPDNIELAPTLLSVNGKDPSNTLITATMGKGYFSVRYPRQIDLELILTEDSEQHLAPKEVESDIEQFCTKQCIAECSNICSFYKYGKYPKP